MASPTLATIRNAVILAIQTGMNSGSPSSVVTVHPYRRFWKDYQKFRALFTRTDAGAFLGLINGWMMKITSSEVEGPEWYRFYRKHRFELDGFMGLQDTSQQHPTPKLETDFLDQIDAIRDQLLLNATVFGNTEDTTPVTQLVDVGPVSINQEATVWHASLIFEVERIATVFS